MVKREHLAYGAIGVGLLGATASFITGGGTIGILGAFVAGIGSVTAIALYKYGYLIVPLITQQTRIVQITDTGYEIPPAQDVVIKQHEGMYYASAFLAIRIYESTTDKTMEENVIYSQYFERAISSVKFPMKVCMLVYVKDLTAFRMKIETKHAEAQLRLARERDKPEPDVLKLDRYEREAAMWEGQINRLTKGVKPMGCIAYVMTTADGVSKDAATAGATRQAGELRSTLANALNVEVTQLKGEEMMRCFEWEYMLPITGDQAEEEVK